jgi:addiction module RelE/StbE family toxin
MEIKYSSQFNKLYQKVPHQIKFAFKDALELFLEDTFNPQLRNHALKVKFAGYRSIDITGDWRAIYKEQGSEEKNVITFYLIGTHVQLYGK